MARLTTLKQIKSVFGLQDHHDYGDILRGINAMRNERDKLTELSSSLRTQRDALYERLTQVVDVIGEPTLEELVERLVTEHGEAVGTVNGLKQLLELPENTSNTSLFQAVESIEAQRDDLYTQVQEQGGATRHTPRYIVHGDIQPCVVLYSDETTTLVRLDENDMMCETDTIEWSDELTYRCQELWVKTQLPATHKRTYAEQLAQLVRDGLVTLNDDEGSYQWKPAADDRPLCIKPDVKYVASKTCMTCLRISEGTLDLCPQCHTPFGGSDNA